jgi:hypothetical protein
MSLASPFFIYFYFLFRHILNTIPYNIRHHRRQNENTNSDVSKPREADINDAFGRGVQFAV